MGDPNVSDQIEELKQQIHIESERSHDRIAELDEHVADLTETITTIAGLSHLRGATASSAGRTLTVAPDPEPDHEPGPGTHRRTWVAVAAASAVLIAAAAFGFWLAAGDGPPAAPVGGSSLTADRSGGDVQHGPAVYPPPPTPGTGSPSPTPVLPDLAAAPGPSAGTTLEPTGTPLPEVRNSATTVPTANPLAAVAPTPSASPSCRVGLQIRRVTVCRSGK